jgi:hypothetical protein
MPNPRHSFARRQAELVADEWGFLSQSQSTIGGLID